MNELRVYLRTEPFFGSFFIATTIKHNYCGQEKGAGKRGQVPFYFLQSRISNPPLILFTESFCPLRHLSAPATQDYIAYLVSFFYQYSHCHILAQISQILKVIHRTLEIFVKYASINS